MMQGEEEGRFHLEELRQHKKIKQFCDHLKTHGYTRIIATDKEAKIIQEGLSQARIFLDGEEEAKMKNSLQYDEAMEMGYLYDQDLFKEFLAIKLIGKDRAVQEEVPDYMKAQTKDLFQCLENLSRECLMFISEGMEIDSRKLLEMTDGERLENDDDITSSFMHFFKYHNHSNSEMSTQCVPHTDSGLVTLIPIANSQGLEILNWKTFSFDKLEEEREDQSEFVVLLGETMARLTCLYFQATVHQVIRDKQSETRYSCPFQLRGRPEAYIDSEGLDCKLFQVSHYAKEKIKIKDFIN